MENTSMPQTVEEHPLDRAARVMKGRPALAAYCRVSVAAIGNWKKRGTPEKQCVRIERATGCVVTRRQLRPLDYLECWPELADESLAVAVEEGCRAEPQTAAAQEAAARCGVLPTQIDRREPDAPSDRRAWDEAVANAERTQAAMKSAASVGG